MLLFLSKCVLNGAISQETHNEALTIWLQIFKASNGKMPIPSAMTNADGRVFYCWDNGRYHLEFETIPNEPSYFFYADREIKNGYWGNDHILGEPIQTEIIELFPLFYRSNNVD